MVLKNTRLERIFAALWLGAYLALHACSAVTIDNDSPPEAQYAEGERLLSKDRYVEAVERFRILKSRYPYSKYAALATLRIGDTHYQEEAFLEATAAYRIFRELYPKHDQAAYALYRIGESNYQMVPDSADRDLDTATAAIEAYAQLIKDYPSSSFVKDAEQKIHTLRGKLAEKEDYVGNFYFIRDHFRSAAERYRTLLDKYPEFGYNEKALYRLAVSYERIGELTKAEESLERLQLEFPNSHAKEVASLREKIEKEKSQ